MPTKTKAKLKPIYKDQVLVALTRIWACERSKQWVRSSPAKTAAQLWRACQDYDFLSYLLNNINLWMSNASLNRVARAGQKADTHHTYGHQYQRACCKVLRREVPYRKVHAAILDVLARY